MTDKKSRNKNNNMNDKLDKVNEHGQERVVQYYECYVNLLLHNFIPLKIRCFGIQFIVKSEIIGIPFILKRDIIE